jgi:peptidoglycan-associated lipoprotein
MYKTLLSSALMLIFSFLTSCGSTQRVYNPNAKFNSGEPRMSVPNTGGPIVGGPGTGVIGSEWDKTGQGPVDPIPGDNSAGTPVDHPFKSSPVYFAYDSAIVGQAYDDLLKSIANYMNSNPNYHLTVGGHCDERGSDEYNRALSERRALAVKQAIIAFGAPDARVNTIGYGEEQPADAGTGLKAYAKNRRAEFAVFAK